MVAPLACPVRGCGLPLARGGSTWGCARLHSFDVARAGYVNLLQPQDRKAAEPGDARAVVEARAQLERRGVGRALIEAVAGHVTAAGYAAPVIADLGCGTGHALGQLHATLGGHGVGLDLSVAAITVAARGFPGLTWVVANADRTLPLLDHSVDVVVSLHGRRNPGEVARVLKPGGVFIVSVPAPDDLIELRERVLGRGEARDRLPALIAEHASLFTVAGQQRVTSRLHVGGEGLAALLRATYRGARHAESARVAGVPQLDVTLSSDLCVLRPVPEPGSTPSSATRAKRRRGRRAR